MPVIKYSGETQNVELLGLMQKESTNFKTQIVFDENGAAPAPAPAPAPARPRAKGKKWHEATGYRHKQAVVGEHVVGQKNMDNHQPTTDLPYFCQIDLRCRITGIRTGRGGGALIRYYIDGDSSAVFYAPYSAFFPGERGS